MIRTGAVLFSSLFLLSMRNMPGRGVSINEEIVTVKKARINTDYETPYLHADLKHGTIFMKSGRVITGVKFRLNLVSNETECVFPNGLTTMLAKGAVKEINFKDTTEHGVVSYKVKNGYPAFDMQTRDNFYIVLSDGRCSFLKSLQKKVIEKVNDMDRNIIREYETTEEFYLFSNGSLKHWKKDKDFLLTELADKKEAIQKFITEKQTSFRNVESVAELINYYNSL